MIITRESIEMDKKLVIPTRHTTLPNSKNLTDFISKNFSIKEYDGVYCLICAPENGIALCELFYEVVFTGDFIDLNKSEDYFGSEGQYRWSEETDEYGVEFEDYDVFMEMCDRERCANLLGLMIKRGYIVCVNRGEKIGPYMKSLYFNNDYYVVPDYQKLLRDGICLDNDVEAKKLLKDYFASYYEDFQFPFVMYLERSSFPDLISYGMFDSIRTMWLTDNLEALSSLPYSPEIRHNLDLFLEYLHRRGCDVDDKNIIDMYNNR